MSWNALLACICLLFISINQNNAEFTPTFRVLTGPTSNVLLNGILPHYQIVNRNVIIQRRLAKNGSIDLPPSASQPDSFDVKVAKQALFNQQVDLVLLGTPLSKAEQAAHPTLAQFPFAALPIVPITNIIDETTNQTISQLNLSGKSLRAIFGGFVTMWNDTLIQNDNPSINLPFQPITVVLFSRDSVINSKFVSSIIQLDQSVNQSNNTSDYVFDVIPSRSPVWPLHRYASYVLTTQVASAVLTYPFSISYCIWQAAVQVGASTASLRNFHSTNMSRINPKRSFHLSIEDSLAMYMQQTRQIVSVSQSSLQQGINIAATIEIQNIDPRQNAITLDLNATVLPFSWPIIHIEYVLYDTATSRSTCTDRAEMVRFVLWLYTRSEQALNDLQAAIMPTSVLTQLDLINRISAIQCRGKRAIPLVSSNGLTVTGEERTSKINSQLLLQHNQNLPPSVRAANEFVWQENESDTAVYQVVYSETSMAMVFREGVSSKLFLTTVADPDYLVFPLFLFGVKLVFNRQITSSLKLDASVRLVFEMIDVLSIIFGAITDWTDPRLLRFNPQLTALFIAHNITTAPITIIFSCRSLQRGTVGHFVNVVMADFVPGVAAQLAQSADAGIDLCKINVYAGIPNVTALTVKHESSTSEAVAQVVGGFGIQWFEGTTRAQLGPIDIMLDGTVRSLSTASMAACATDSLSPDATIIAWKSKNPACYPFSQTMYSTSAARYRSSESGPRSCVSGRLSVGYISSLLTDSTNDAAFNSAGIVRLGSVPGLIEAALGRTGSLYQTAFCDDEPLLTRPAVEWKMDRDFQRFTYFLGALGVALPSASFLLVCCFGNRQLDSSNIQPSAPSMGLPFFALMTLGCVFLSSSIFTIVVPASIYSCSATMWLICLGTSILSTPLFAQTLDRYLAYMTVGRFRLTPRMSTIIVTMICTVDILLLATWQTVSPREPQIVQENTDSFPTLYALCAQPEPGLAFYYTFVCIKSALLLLGSCMSWSLRHFLELRNVGRLWYVVLVTVVVAELVSHSGTALLGNEGIGLRVWTISIITLSTSALLYVPVFVLILNKNKVKPVKASLLALRQSIKQIDHPSQVPLSFDFPHIRVMDENMLVSYIAALDGEVAQMNKAAIEDVCANSLLTTNEPTNNLSVPSADQVHPTHKHSVSSVQQSTTQHDPSQIRESFSLDPILNELTAPNVLQRKVSRFDSINENPAGEMTTTADKLPIVL